MMLFEKKLAFTLAEMMFAMIVIAVLIGATASRVLKQSPDVEKTRIKKAYITIEKTISSMVDNDVIYSGDLMMKNLEGVTTSVGDQFGTNDANTKFRDVFMYYQNIVEEDIPCFIKEGDQDVEVNHCFRTSDGVVYGVPDTDFENVGVQLILDDTRRNRSHKYVPITVYPNFDSKKNINDDVMIVGVRYDGRIKMITQDCTDETISCNVLDILHSENIKRERN